MIGGRISREQRGQNRTMPPSDSRAALNTSLQGPLLAPCPGHWMSSRTLGLGAGAGGGGGRRDKLCTLDLSSGRERDREPLRGGIDCDCRCKGERERERERLIIAPKMQAAYSGAKNGCLVETCNVPI